MKARKRNQPQDTQAELKEITVARFDPPSLGAVSILLPMAGSGFFESQDIARLRRLNKSANANFGMSVIKEVFANNKGQFSTIKRNLITTINSNINALSNNVSTKQAMVMHMENIDNSHSLLTSLVRQSISSMKDANRVHAGLNPCLTIFAILLAIYGLFFAKNKMAFCAPLIVNIGYRVAHINILNISSNDLALLRKIQQDVGLYVYNQNRIARQGKILVGLQKKEKEQNAASALPTIKY